MMKNEKIKQKISALAQKSNLSLVLIFGSHANGKMHSKSDIDIAYYAEKTLDTAEESKLIIELIEIFKTSSIDLVSLKTASPLLLQRIANTAEVMYQSEPTKFNEFKIVSFKNTLRQNRFLS